ncbi:unnamed protein product [marine sediment metagenome]|uniref:Uncharacterized protein n=1 Tax=marine sediment metagenome TaxID=412755 RepID=X1GCV0_9ZZZZ
MKSKVEIKAMIKKCKNDLPQLKKRGLWSHVSRLEIWIKSLTWVLDD